MHAIPILFTLGATPAPRKVTRKPSLCAGREKIPSLCTLSTLESTVEQTFCFYIPVYTVYADNCEHTEGIDDVYCKAGREEGRRA